MTEVNGTNTTLMFVCWLPFKVEIGKQRESEKGRVNTPMSVFVNRFRLGTHWRLVEGNGWGRLVSRRPIVASTTFRGGLFARRLERNLNVIEKVPFLNLTCYQVLMNEWINKLRGVLQIVEKMHWQCEHDYPGMSSGRRATRPVRQLSLQQPAPRRQHIRRQRSAEDDCNKSLQIYANPIARGRLNATEKPKVR